MFTHGKIAVLLLLGIFALTSPLVYAADETQPASKESAFKQKAEEKMQQLYTELNVTPEQRAQLEANKAKNMAEVKTLMTSMREQRELMRAEFQKDQLNEAIVRSISNEIKALQNRMSDLRLEGMLSIRKILTPEQFKKFTEKMEKNRPQFPHKAGKRGAGPEAKNEGPGGAPSQE